MLVNEVQAGNPAAIHILTSNIIPPKYVVNNRLYLPFYKLALVNAYSANSMMFLKHLIETSAIMESMNGLGAITIQF